MGLGGGGGHALITWKVASLVYVRLIEIGLWLQFLALQAKNFDITIYIMFHLYAIVAAFLLHDHRFPADLQDGSCLRATGNLQGIVL
jgi:hypothetical protein